MRFLTWPKFANHWMWLCPILAVGIAAAGLWSFGFSWWSALLAAVILVCPTLILWGAIQVVIAERQRRRYPGT